MPIGWMSESDLLRAAAAVACAQAGATVVLLGRKVAPLNRVYDAVKEVGSEPLLYPLDLVGASPDDFDELAQRLEAELGRLDGGDVGVEQVIQQAALVRAQLLAALGKLVPLENGDFVGELLDDGLIAVDLFAHRIDLRQQLRGQCAQLLSCQLVEIGRGSHAADCARAGRQRRYPDGLMAGATAL